MSKGKGEHRNTFQNITLLQLIFRGVNISEFLNFALSKSVYLLVVLARRWGLVIQRPRFRSCFPARWCWINHSHLPLCQFFHLYMWITTYSIKQMWGEVGWLLKAFGEVWGAVWPHWCWYPTHVWSPGGCFCWCPLYSVCLRIFCSSGAHFAAGKKYALVGITINLWNWKDNLTVFPL